MPFVQILFARLSTFGECFLTKVLSILHLRFPASGALDSGLNIHSNSADRH